MTRKDDAPTAALKERWRALANAAGIGADERLVLGLSGGADSVALALLASAGTPRGQLELVHADHGWRDGAAELELCRDLAARLERPLHTATFPPPPRIANAEDWSRALRYHLFVERARATGASVVLAAHHRTDQVETVLLGWRRSGRPGRPMAVARDLGHDFGHDLADGVRLVRPLLALAPSELRALLVAADQPWCEDPTNLDRGRARNAVRHDLLPLLRRAARELGSELDLEQGSGLDLERALLELGAARVAIDAAFDAARPTLERSPWGIYTRSAAFDATTGSFPREAFARFPRPVRDEVLARSLRDATGFASAAGVIARLSNAIGLADPCRVQLEGDWEAEVSVERVDLLPAGPRRLDHPPDPLVLTGHDGPTAFVSDGRAIAADTAFALAGGAPARVRGWRPGDRAVAWRGRPERAFTRVLAEHGIPAEERRFALVVERRDARGLVGPLPLARAAEVDGDPDPDDR